MKQAVVLVYSLVALSCCVDGLIETLYCGNENCYEVLGLDRDAEGQAIRKAYRKLAVQYHPDKNKTPGSRERFQLISTAYEVLKDEEERANYDYMLDHPDEVYRHYYHYYKRRVTPKIDARIVIAVSVVVISLLQYIGWSYMYNTAIKAALRMPRYRQRAKDIAMEKGLIKIERVKRRKDVSKEEAKAEEEEILRKIMEENLNVLGGYSKPKVWDILLFKIFVWPYQLYVYVVWYVTWVWRFSIRGMEYGDEEKKYLTRKKLKLSTTQWEALGDDVREDLIGRELWVEKNLEEYRTTQEEEMRVKQAESSKHKMYRRYMKNRTSSQPILTD